MWALTPMSELGTPSNKGPEGLVGVIELLLNYVVTGVLVYVTVQALMGRRAGLGECMVRGLSLIWPVLGVSIVVAIVTGLASLLLVIPGLIVACMLWVAVPAAVVERRGVSASLSRSAELTKGHRWPVFGIIVLSILLALVVSFALGIGVAILAFAFDQSSLALFSQVAELLATAFITALLAATAAVSYHDLRFVKEGIEIDEIAAVFD